jgi:hypothetical protein
MKKKYNYFFYLILIYIVIYISYLLYELDDKKSNNRKLEEDGYIIINNPYNKYDVLKKLPKGYNFINYIYEIKGCAISTFHRDITSSQYIFNTKYPVYTYVIYHNTGRLLSVSPGSHKTIPFLWKNIYTISGKGNTGVLFNSDLIHAGAINKFGDKRHIIQYKICHYEDLNKLNHLIGINTTKIGNCKNNNKNYEFILRKFSLLFPFIINHLFTGLIQKKPDKDSLFDYLINKFYIGDFYSY